MVARYSYPRALALPLLLGFAGTLAAQADAPGEVQAFKKISETQGGFTGDLDNLDQLGRAVIALGDFDGDGNPDLGVGAYGDDDGGANRGAVWLLRLTATGSVASQQKISATVGGFVGPLADGDNFGRAMCNMGDLDGDGITDIAVGASDDDDGGTNRGAVWILFLNADMTVKAEQKISDTQGGFTGMIKNHDQFGRSLAAIGDLNGDGVTELAVGSYGDTGGESAGAVWILFMNEDGTVDHHSVIEDNADFPNQLDEDDRFGHSVAAVGDVDFDGVPDLMVGAVLDDDGPEGNQGAVYMLSLFPSGRVKTVRKYYEGVHGFTGDIDQGDQFGTSCAMVGDVNGDGVKDIAIGAGTDDDGADGAGAVWILFLDPFGEVIGHTKIANNSGGMGLFLTAGIEFSSAIAALGDVNNDAIPDLAIGARYDFDGGPGHGAVYIMLLDGVPEPPVSEFTSVKRSGTAPLSVSFVNEATGGFVSQEWDFGDGNLSTDVNPMHVFADPGTYTVSLETTGPAGVSTETKVDYVAVDERYGCLNPPESLQILGGYPGIGDVLKLGITNPFNTQAAGTFAVLWGALLPDPMFPCGLPIPGIGMAGPGTPGEVLVDFSTVAVNLQATPWLGPGTYSRVDLPIPNNPPLVGIDAYLQGFMIDILGPVPYGLTDAIRMSIR